MGPVAIILLSLLGLFLVFVGIILIRTLQFKPKAQPKLQIDDISFDKEEVVKNLQELVRCKTVSNPDHSKEDDAEFRKLLDKLPTLYPEVFKQCEYTELEERGILFKLKGKSSEKPSVLMAHYDVVPVDEEQWEKDPFGAEIIDGVMWGRGTLDTKVTFNGALFSVNHMLKQGFVPENDLYLAFSGGEEVNGLGAVKIVDYFKANGITPAIVVDEGGAVVEDVFPGVKQPCGLIGIAEKGLMNVEYKVESNGGHASAPKPHTPVGTLSAACVQIENNPFPYHVTKPVAEMFDTLGRYSTFVYRMIFANMWLFSGVLNGICKKSGGEMNALMRTTVAFTSMQGSKAYNVIPPKATMVSNMRLNPQDTIDTAIEYLKKTIKDDSVSVTLIEGMNPSPISETYCEAWDKVATAVASTWKGSIVSPYLMVQCSDSRHYGDISNHVYRFSALDMTKEERGSIHGNNEKIRLESLYRSVEFYIRLVKQL